MNAGRTARERARVELTREITDVARRQLAEAGADGLSLRAVARELGMVSSALYRYFPSRDDLLTALILDAYEALGDAAESADRAHADAEPTRRWRAACTAVRDWAVRHPHEYALIYGSPIPGYRAPQDTIAQAARVPLVVLRILEDALTGGQLADVPDRPLPGPVLAEQLRGLTDSVPNTLPGPVLTCALIAWTQLFGMLSFELFGQLVGSVDPSTEFFDNAVGRMAEFVGLPPES